MSTLRVVFDSKAYTSTPILDEVRDLLQRPKFGLSLDQALVLVAELHDLCEVVTAGKRVKLATLRTRGSTGNVRF
jgi:hypothetical protein